MVWSRKNSQFFLPRLTIRSSAFSAIIVRLSPAIICSSTSVPGHRFRAHANAFASPGVSRQVFIFHVASFPVDFCSGLVLLTFGKARSRRHSSLSPPRWRTVRRSAQGLSVRADGVRNVHTWDFYWRGGPNRRLPLSAIPVQPLNPAYASALQHTAEPRKMGLRMDAFSGPGWWRTRPPTLAR